MEQVQSHQQHKLKYSSSEPEQPELTESKNKKKYPIISLSNYIH